MSDIREMRKYDHPVHGKIVIKDIGENVVSFFSNGTYGKPLEYSNKQDLIKKLNNEFHYNPKEPFTIEKFAKYISAEGAIKRAKLEETKKQKDFMTRMVIDKIFPYNEKRTLQNELLSITKTMYYQGFFEDTISQTDLFIKYSLFLNENEELQNSKRFVKNLEIDTYEFDKFNPREFSNLKNINIKSSYLNYGSNDRLSLLDTIETLAIKIDTEDFNFLLIPENVVNLKLMSDEYPSGVLRGNMYSLTNLKSFESNIPFKDTTFLPFSVEKIKFTNFNKEDFFIPKSTKILDITFTDTLSLKDLPDSISTLKLRGNRYIQIENLPKDLKVLKIYNTQVGQFNLDKVIPYGLKELIFYCRKIDFSTEKLPPTLETLSLGLPSSEDNLIGEEELILPDGLKNFIFLIHKKLIVKKWPPGLKTILIHNIDPIDFATLPNSIEEFHASLSVNKNLKLKNIKSFSIPFGTAYSNFENYLPSSLNSLYMRYVNETISNLPIGLKRLVCLYGFYAFYFRGDSRIEELIVYSNNISTEMPIYIPPNLKELKTSRNILLRNLPETIEEIDDFEGYISLKNSVLILNRGYSHKLPRIPGSIKSVIFSKDFETDYYSLDFSEGVNLLYLPDDYRTPLNILPMSMNVIFIPIEYFNNNSEILYENKEMKIFLLIKSKESEGNVVMRIEQMFGNRMFEKDVFIVDTNDIED